MNSYGYDNALRKRLAQLRVQKGVSAREMSLALGQNTGYISNIESGLVFSISANISTSPPVISSTSTRRHRKRPPK